CIATTDADSPHQPANHGLGTTIKGIMEIRFGKLCWFTAALGFGCAFFKVQALAQAGDYTYWTNNGTITITGYSGPGGDVTIPSVINGLEVTGIGDYAFWRNTNLTA